MIDDDVDTIFQTPEGDYQPSVMIEMYNDCAIKYIQVFLNFFDVNGNFSIELQQSFTDIEVKLQCYFFNFIKLLWIIVV